MDEQEFLDLLARLVESGGESEICEFKKSNSNMERLGQIISSLSNSAALNGEEFAYLIFGVDNDGNIVGTKFNTKNRHKGQEIKNWLTTQLNPEVNFEIHTLSISGKRIEVFRVYCAAGYPVQFKGIAYIRVGSYTKPLSSHRGKEKALWQNLSPSRFESSIARANCSAQNVALFLDCDAYRRLSPNASIGLSMEALLREMCAEGLLKQSGVMFSITNLGALLYAKNLAEFSSLKRKVPRIITYRGNNNLYALNEIDFPMGYALSLGKIVSCIQDYLPKNEEIQRVFRQEHTLYPEVAVRELVVNALIHQDLMAVGSSPTVEIFEGRVEIKNPGEPLIEINRLLNASPKSRNERLAKAVRDLGLCEERGTGIDRVVKACESYQLPAPLFDLDGSSSTIAVLYAPKDFSHMDMKDKIRATYLHCCLKFAGNDYMTNQSLRERFGIDDQNYPQVSRIIKRAIKDGKIKFKDSEVTKGRYVSYVPAWVR